MNKLQVVESIFTNHKLVTCLDSTPRDSGVVLGGHEDGTVKLYDQRTHIGGVKQHKVFEASTSSYTSAVKICPKNHNLFAATNYDGKVRLWDLRNENEPLHVLKGSAVGKKTQEFKLFALGWSAKADWIVSGGSDSNIQMHSLNL